MIEVLVAAVVGMTLHEAAHAYVARLHGDPTAALLGRATLNPLAHLDPVGSVLLPAASWLLLGVPVGWGRTVPINRLRLRRRGYLLAVAAGPAANLYVSGVFALGGLWSGALVNLVLAGLNLLPVGNLDGRRILQELI